MPGLTKFIPSLPGGIGGVQGLAIGVLVAGGSPSRGGRPRMPPARTPWCQAHNPD
ncbi:MAG: hypothetical protein ACPG9N_01850 [Miltoncostaeaceae bacterium]